MTKKLFLIGAEVIKINPVIKRNKRGFYCTAKRYLGNGKYKRGKAYIVKAIKV